MKKTIYSLLLFIFLWSCDNETCDSSSSNRTGAVCKDGTTSSSVGSGTCSGHGGVDHWLCD